MGKEDIFSNVKGQIIDTGSKDFKLRSIEFEMQSVATKISSSRLQLRRLQNIANILLGKSDISIGESTRISLERDGKTYEAEVLLKYKVHNIVPTDPVLQIKFKDRLVYSQMSKASLFETIRTLKKQIKNLDKEYSNLAKEHSDILNNKDWEKRDLQKQKEQLEKELKIIEEKLKKF